MRVDLDAVFPIPKSWAKRKREQAAEGDICPMTKPDLDNVVKIALDALNGVAWEDDKQVVWIGARKEYVSAYGDAPDCGCLRIRVTRER